MQSFCTGCGRALGAGDVFCPACGTRAAAASAPGGMPQGGAPAGAPTMGTPYQDLPTMAASPGTPQGTPYPGTPQGTPYPGTPQGTPYPGTPYPGQPYQGAAGGPAQGGQGFWPPSGGGPSQPWGSGGYPDQPGRPLAPQLAQRLPQLPRELLIVCGVLPVIGAGLVVRALMWLPDVFDVWTAGDRARLAGGVLLVFMFSMMAVGGGLIAIAWRLTLADDVATWLAYVAAGVVFGAVLFSSGFRFYASFWAWVVLVGLGACAAVLTLGPATRAFLAGQVGPQYRQPKPVVTARVVLAVVGGHAALSGMLLVIASDVGMKYLLMGLLLLAAGGAVVTTFLQLRTPNALARQVASGAGALFALVNLWELADGDAASLALVPMGLAATFAALLWGPAESRRWFQGHR